MCTHTLVGNLSLWRVIKTLVGLNTENGFVEAGMKHKSL